MNWLRRITIRVPFEASIVNIDLFESGRFLKHGQESFRALVWQLQVTATELQKKGIELQGGDDRN